MMAFNRETTEHDPWNQTVQRRVAWPSLGKLTALILWFITAEIAVCAPPVDPKNSTASALQPEMRYVAVEQASLYAGPSEDFYPTMHLARGSAIEVYHRTGDGWLAIRPPQGSFSWLPAAQGLLLPGGRIVEVTDKSAVAWIGTSLGTAKQYRWQVKLNHGEQLAVLGEQSIRDEASGNKSLWYKITPPNGEYRWIQEKATTSDDPSELAQASDDTSPGGNTDIDSASVNLAANSEDSSADNDGAVQPASNEEVVGSSVGSSVRRTGSRASRSNPPNAAKAHTSEDPWDSWHAVEFKNGALSFPGVARMFGMQPSSASNSQTGYDPFDPRNNSRPRSTPMAQHADTRAMKDDRAQDTLDNVVDASSTATSDQLNHSLLENEQRGWRDPRQLRMARQRASNMRGGSNSVPGEMLASQANDATSTETSLSESSSIIAPAYATVTGQDDAVGSAIRSDVVPASVNMPGDQSSRQGDDENWYGIRQAPPASTNTVGSNAVASGSSRPLVLSNADLAEVQLRLSEMVAGPEHTWNLAPLADRTRYLIEHGATAIERGEARLLLDRIDAFSQLAKRSSALGMTVASPMSQSSPTQLPVASAINSSSPLNAAAARWASPLGVNPASGTAGESSSASSVAPRFDATGWVVPVHGSNRDMPTHALTNDSGKIIVYLTPAPGINLARYQAQAVGVYGLRGYLPQLRANHIQVQRAVRLQ